MPTIWPVHLNVSKPTCPDTLTSVAVLTPVKVTPESTMAVPLVANTQTHLVTGRIFNHKDVIIIVNKGKVLFVISLRVCITMRARLNQCTKYLNYINIDSYIVKPKKSTPNAIFVRFFRMGVPEV